MEVDASMSVDDERKKTFDVVKLVLDAWRVTRNSQNSDDAWKKVKHSMMR